MTWKCIECQKAEGEKDVVVDAVCHHCGMPLCRQHQRVILDDCFSRATGPLDRSAVHCGACHQHYHPRAELVGSARRG